MARACESDIQVSMSSEGWGYIHYIWPGSTSSERSRTKRYSTTSAVAGEFESGEVIPRIEVKFVVVMSIIPRVMIEQRA